MSNKKPQPTKNSLSKYSVEDQAAFQKAFADVTPIKRTSYIPKEQKNKLVNQNDKMSRTNELATIAWTKAASSYVEFSIERNQDDEIRGIRSDDNRSLFRTIEGTSVKPQATLDLHGQRGEKTKKLVQQFIQNQHAQGKKVLLIIHGKGINSEGGVGVLQNYVIEAIQQYPASLLVRAFMTAPQRLGGRGAMVVRLDDRFKHT